MASGLPLNAPANPLAAAKPAIEQALARDLVGPLSNLRSAADSIDVVLQRRYNPEGKSNLNVVPGLLAVILTQTMVMMTALAVTRERERVDRVRRHDHRERGGLSQPYR